jgi:hypothetical protein
MRITMCICIEELRRSEKMPPDRYLGFVMTKVVSDKFQIFKETKTLQI